jgi:hypothetical protein
MQKLEDVKYALQILTLKYKPQGKSDLEKRLKGWTDR